MRRLDAWRSKLGTLGGGSDDAFWARFLAQDYFSLAVNIRAVEVVTLRYQVLIAATVGANQSLHVIPMLLPKANPTRSLAACVEDLGASERFGRFWRPAERSVEVLWVTSIGLKCDGQHKRG
jgi:hypothetical protein